MPTALIMGAGSGLSASLVRKLVDRGDKVILAARNIDKLDALCQETSAIAIYCDASIPASVADLFQQIAAMGQPLEVAIYNPSARVRGPVTELDPEAVRNSIEVTAFGAFLMAQQAARMMLPRGKGAILFTGASAGVKGFANSSSFAMGKFALRGLAQSLARELHPKGIHIGHFVIDGGIENQDRPDRISPTDNPDSMLHPDAIADSYMHFLDQPRSSWAWEIELRPWVEKF